MKSDLSKRRPGKKAKKCLYEGVIVLIGLNGVEAWGDEKTRKKESECLEMKCLGSLVGVSRTERVWIYKVSRRAGIESNLASRADQRVLRRFGHVKRMDEYRMGRRVLIAEVSEERIRGRPK